MYKEDANHERILWHENPTNKVPEYHFLTVTSAVPHQWLYLAFRILLQLASDGGYRLSGGALAVQKYMFGFLPPIESTFENKSIKWGRRKRYAAFWGLSIAIRLDKNRDIDASDD